MAFVAKFAASKFVGDKLENHFGPENPKYDFYKTEDGRRKKVKKPLPQGLSYHDERVLQKVRRKAWKYEWWVDAMCCCGIHVQFGTVTLWGLIPFIGDAISLLKALTLINAARKVEGGLPSSLVFSMLIWAAIDFAIKLVPFVGDLVTAIIKPNTRNLARVEAFLAKKAAKNLRRGDGPVVTNAHSRGGGSSSRGATVVVEQQPTAQRGMAATSSAAEAGVGSYGTVQQSGTGAKRRGERHILPFFRKNEESDSEDEGLAPRR